MVAKLAHLSSGGGCGSPSSGFTRVPRYPAAGPLHTSGGTAAAMRHFDFQGRPVPYARDSSACNTPRRYVSATHEHFGRHDVSSAWVPRRTGVDFQGYPVPFATDGRGADTPDRYVSAAQRHFRERLVHAAAVERRRPCTFAGTLVPYATHDEGNIALATQIPATWVGDDVGDGLPRSARATGAAHAGLGARHIAVAPRARTADWSTTHRASFIPMDLLAARPLRRAGFDPDDR